MYIHDLIRIPAHSNTSAAEHQIKGNKRIYAVHQQLFSLFVGNLK